MNYIDFDELFNLPTKNPVEQTLAQPDKLSQHEEAFNLYELPFTDMKFDVAIDHFIYHNVDLQKIKGSIRTTQNHYIHIDTLSMNAADGKLSLSGYFNGSDPKNIYFKPNLVTEGIAIDKLLFKFENFGQDQLVSDNLKGNITSSINGKIRMHPDMVPDLDQSEIHMDIQVLDGRLQNYDPITALADYMGDKNLKNIKFDTLQNHVDVAKGRITIPSMTIESTLGHMEFSGTQDLDDTMEYYLKIPWKTVKQAAWYKLFGRKNKDSIVCLLYTSPSPRDQRGSRMPSSA